MKAAKKGGFQRKDGIMNINYGVFVFTMRIIKE